MQCAYKVEGFVSSCDIFDDEALDNQGCLRNPLAGVGQRPEQLAGTARGKRERPSRLTVGGVFYVAWYVAGFRR